MPKDVGFAWDFMTVCPATFHLLPAMRPALEEIFQSEFEYLHRFKKSYLKNQTIKRNNEDSSVVTDNSQERTKEYIVPYRKRGNFTSLEEEL